MAKWHAKLVKDGHIGADQLQEAEAIARKKAKKVEAILVELGYVTSDVLRQYQTAALGYEMVDLKAIEVDASVIEQVPESVARENVVFPVEMRGDSLVVALNDPMNLEVLDKLRFILNRDVQVVVAPTEAIQAAINAHYGQHQNESVDSIIAEFTETPPPDAADARQPAGQPARQPKGPTTWRRGSHHRRRPGLRLRRARSRADPSPRPCRPRCRRRRSAARRAPARRRNPARASSPRRLRSASAG